MIDNDLWRLGAVELGQRFRERSLAQSAVEAGLVRIEVRTPPRGLAAKVHRQLAPPVVPCPRSKVDLLHELPVRHDRRVSKRRAHSLRPRHARGSAQG